MPRAFGPVDIKFLLQELIDRGIQRKRISRRLLHPELAVKVKAPRAVDKQINLPPTQPEQLPRSRIILISCAVWIVILGHIIVFSF